MQMDCDPFWVNDPLLLLRIDRIIEFYPTIDMCPNERINAITRFILYSGLCVAFVKNDIKPLAISLAMIATLAFLYYPKSDKEMLEVYFQNKQQNAVKFNEDNPFMNLLPLDPYYKNNANKQSPCPMAKHLQLPDDRMHTVPKITAQSKGGDDFAHSLYPKDMGECKNGNQKACMP